MAAVRHETFGTGVVRHVGEYKGVPSVWIDFDYGERKALALEFGVPHLRRLGRLGRRTPPDPEIRCEVCGGLPVVLNLDAQQFCDEHRTSYRPPQ